MIGVMVDGYGDGDGRSEIPRYDYTQLPSTLSSNSHLGQKPKQKSMLRNS
jgi:hypothetical protein